MRTEKVERFGADHIEGTVLDQRQLADTSLQGIGTCLVTLRADGEISNDDKVGIRDRIEHKWIVNPYGVGRRA